MKPTTNLYNRHAALLDEISDGSTVEYFNFVGVPNAFTGEIASGGAYPISGVTIAALIDFAPSEAMRKKYGRSLEFNAIIRLAHKHTEDCDISPVVGDAFRLPQETEIYIVVRVAKDLQYGKEFLEQVIMLKRGGVKRV